MIKKILYYYTIIFLLWYIYYFYSEYKKIIFQTEVEYVNERDSTKFDKLGFFNVPKRFENSSNYVKMMIYKLSLLIFNIKLGIVLYLAGPILLLANIGIIPDFVIKVLLTTFLDVIGFISNIIGGILKIFHLF